MRLQFIDLYSIVSSSIQMCMDELKQTPGNRCYINAIDVGPANRTEPMSFKNVY